MWKMDDVEVKEGFSLLVEINLLNSKMEMCWEDWNS